MSTKRDLLVVGLVVTVAGIVWLAVAGMIYVNGSINQSQACSGAGYSAISCQTAIAEAGLNIFWVLLGIGVFLIGLWGSMKAFAGGEDALGSRMAPAGRMCPACRTWQQGPFCSNDGTKLA